VCFSHFVDRQRHLQLRCDADQEIERFYKFGNHVFSKHGSSVCNCHSFACGLKDENFYKPDAMDLLQLALFTCIPLSFGQLAVNQALLMTKNYGLVTPFMFSSIVAGYIISIVRYGEDANVICLAGNVGIIVGVTLLLRSKAD